MDHFFRIIKIVVASCLFWLALAGLLATLRVAPMPPDLGFFIAGVGVLSTLPALVAPLAHGRNGGRPGPHRTR